MMAKQTHKENSRRTRKEAMKNEYFEGICKGLQSAVELLDSGQKLTFDKIRLSEEPKKMRSTDIITLRKKLRVSQRVFASLLNVSAKTVQAWEHRQNCPSGPCLRLLQIMDEYPEVPTRILRKAYTGFLVSQKEVIK